MSTNTQIKIDEFNFIYTLKLDTTQQHVEQLNKRFRMATDIYRKTLIEISKRHKKMKKDPLYKKAYQFPDDKKGKKERNKILKELSKKYDLEGVYTFTSFANTYRNKRNYSDYIPSDVAGTLGRRAWDAYSKKMFNKGAKKVNFSKVVDSIEGIKDTGIIVREGILKMGTKRSRAKFSCPVIYENDDFEKEILKNRVKFCRIVRKKEFGKYTFYVQFILFGKPVIRTKSPLNATVGIDIGLTTIALSSHYETELLEIAANINHYEREIRLLQRKMDRQRRENNPDNYNEDGTIKRGYKKWHNSKAYLETRDKLYELHRKQREARRLAHEELSNRIVEKGNAFVVEQMSFDELAKRHEIGRISKITGKNLSKAGFGKHIGRKAPAMLIEKIKYKSLFRNSKFILADTEKVSATQLNHENGELHSLELSTRVKEIGEKPVQRDLYAAFILEHVSEDGTSVDLNACKKDFERFLRNQEFTMNSLKNTTPSMGVAKWKKLNAKAKAK